MTTRPRTPAGRRQDALSRDRIVGVAVELLDADGEEGLTFRALAARLSTGPGAIYWHVANKDELLTAATAAVLAHTLDTRSPDASPAARIREIALSMFDAIDAHPWIGPQLPMSRSLWQTAMLELIGQQLERGGVPAALQFDGATTVISFVLGAGGQNAVNGRSAWSGTRSEFLEQITGRWADLDPAEYPFVHRVAADMREHDDREQFRAGVDILLAGLGVLDEPLR